MSNLKELNEMLSQVKELVKQTELLLEKSKDIVEASAAKVITDITAELKKCQCNKEILDTLKDLKISESQPDKQIIKKDDDSQAVKSTFQLEKYTFPNFNVGNADLGSSGNPNPVKYPPDP